jgi:hypothetical protein
LNNLFIYLFIYLKFHPSMHMTRSLFEMLIHICSRKRLEGLSLVLAGFSSFLLHQVTEFYYMLNFPTIDSSTMHASEK